MRFEWLAEVETGGCALRAWPDDHDASPRPGSLCLDLRPRLLSDARLAAAAVLAFGPFLSGRVDLGVDAQPELVSAIADFVSPTTVHVTRIDDHPKPYATGLATFALEPRGPGWEETGSSASEPGVITLRMPSSGEVFSYQYAQDVLTVPTNAALFDIGAAQSAWPVYLALGVLLAADYDVGTLRLPSGIARSDKTVRAAGLLRACGLVLSHSQARNTGREQAPGLG